MLWLAEIYNEFAGLMFKIPGCKRTKFIYPVHFVDFFPNVDNILHVTNGMIFASQLSGSVMIYQLTSNFFLTVVR